MPSTIWFISRARDSNSLIPSHSRDNSQLTLFSCDRRYTRRQTRVARSRWCDSSVSRRTQNESTLKSVVAVWFGCCVRRSFRIIECGVGPIFQLINSACPGGKRLDDCVGVRLCRLYLHGTGAANYRAQDEHGQRMAGLGADCKCHLDVADRQEAIMV